MHDRKAILGIMHRLRKVSLAGDMRSGHRLQMNHALIVGAQSRRLAHRRPDRDPFRQQPPDLCADLVWAGRDGGVRRRDVGAE